MADLFENSDRMVIPNWRGFKSTVYLGELDSPGINPDRNITQTSIELFILDWKNNKTVNHASELLSSAYVNRHLKDPSAIEAAQFILRNSKVTPIQVSLAERFLNHQISNTLQEELLFEDLDTSPHLSNIHRKINKFKKQTIKFQYNSILYVELSRLYSMLGQKVKARKAMKTALYLTPNNRYILRSASRLFTHVGEIDYAHELLRRNPLTKYDPWLTSAEISLATLNDKSSRLMKVGIGMAESKSFSPRSLTELSSSIGTVELVNGSQKKGRRFFNLSLISPNDNSLAQAEWANNSVRLFEYLDSNAYNVQNNFEALMLHTYYLGKWNDSLLSAKNFLVDMPYIKRPVIFGHHLSSTILNLHDIGIKFCEIGLLSHPNDPQIINNIAYSYALSGRTDKAIEYLLRVENVVNVQKSARICLMATNGLIHFRRGNPELGRPLYLKAIEDTKESDLIHLHYTAILNYAREEIICKSEKMEFAMGLVVKIPNSLYIDIDKLKKDVVNLYGKTKL